MKNLCLSITIMLSMICNLATAVPAQVKLSDFNPRKNDATPAIQAAFDSGASRIIIDNPGFELLVHRQLNLRSNLEIVIHDGVTIAAAPGAFKSLGAFLLSAVDCRNIRIRGEGKATLKMRKKDYQDSKRYRHSEWRHLLSFKGCEEIDVRNLTLLSSGGDGIYIGCSRKKSYCKNLIFEDLVISDHHRQGISVISAENLQIRRCKISDTSGTAPAAGIDFEPNHTPEGQRIVNCLVEDCVISGNESSGIGIYTVYLEGGCPPQSITVRRCRISGNGEGVAVTTSFFREGREHIAPPTGFIAFEDCVIDGNHGPAVRISDQLPTVKVSFERCRLKTGNTAGSIPVQIAIRNMRGAPVGNLIFENVTVADWQPGREVVGFKSWTNADLTDITGRILLEYQGRTRLFPLEKRIAEIRREIQRRRQTPFQTSQIDWKNFIPAETSVQNNGKLMTRGNIVYVIAAKTGEQVNLMITRPQLQQKNIKLVVKSTNGKSIVSKELPAQKRQVTLSFKAPYSGAYCLSASSGPDALVIQSSHPGGWLLNRPLLITGKSARCYFAVPAGVKDFDIQIAGRLNLPVKACLLNPEGKTAASSDRIEEPCRLRGKASGRKREIWALEIEMSSDRQLAELQPGKGLENIISVGSLPYYTGKKQKVQESAVNPGEYTGNEN